VLAIARKAPPPACPKIGGGPAPRPGRQNHRQGAFRARRHRRGTWQSSGHPARYGTGCGRRRASIVGRSLALCGHRCANPLRGVSVLTKVADHLSRGASRLPAKTSALSGHRFTRCRTIDQGKSGCHRMGRIGRSGGGLSFRARARSSPVRRAASARPHPISTRAVPVRRHEAPEPGDQSDRGLPAIGDI